MPTRIGHSFIERVENKFISGLGNDWDGDGPCTPPRCVEGSGKFYFVQHLFMKYALKSVPGLADVGFLHGDGDGPRTPLRCLERSGKSFK